MKLNKEVIKDEDVDDGTVRMLPDGTLYSVYDPKPIQAFVGLADTLKQPLINLQGNIDSFQKAVQNIISPVMDFRKTILEQFVEPMRVADNFGKTVVPQYLQSVSVMQDLLKSTQDSIKVFNDLVVTDFPLKNSFVSIDPSTVLDFGVLRRICMTKNIRNTVRAKVSYRIK